MKRKYINAILACGMMVSLAACTDVWEEHYQSNPALNGSESLWELISNDPELDDFEAVLQATGYDEILKQNRSYTVWAPINLSDELMASLETASDSLLEVYRKEYVENHIADYSQVAGGIRDKEDKKSYKRVVVLNGKSYHFEGTVANAYSFAGQPLKASNIVATNGVLHKLDKIVPFAANIWEQMAKEPSISSLYAFLNKDTKIEFNVNASVLGPIVDGKQTYLDSVFTIKNRWIDWGGIGRLNIEDSTYTMYALTNKAWEELYAKVISYYNYPEVKVKEELGGESLKVIADSLVREKMCENLVFSNTVNKKFFQGECDTLISTRYSRFINKGDSREADSLHYGCLEDKELELSNGTLHIIDQVNYKPWTWGYDTIRVQAESLRDGENVAQGSANASESLYANMTFVPVDRDHALYGQISGGGVTVFQPRYDPAKDKSKQPKFHIYAKNVLSANYRISVVMVPAHLLDPEEAKSTKKNVFNAYMECINSEGTKVIKNLVQGKTYTPGEKVDTIVLAENFKIDYCEADYKALTGKEPITRLVIETPTTYSTRSNTTVYRIDQVMFEPIEEIE